MTVTGAQWTTADIGGGDDLVFERDNPGRRVMRLRPGFIFKRESASQQRRLFAGPFLPAQLVGTRP